MKFEVEDGERIRVEQTEIDSLVHQFMHGIYS